MAKKHLVTITEIKGLKAESKVFAVSFVRYMMGLVFFGSFDLREFNKNGYLVKLAGNFRQERRGCYIMISSFGGVRGASDSNIDKVLAMTDYYLALDPIMPERISDKIFFSYPNPIYFLLLREDISRLGEIFDLVDSIDTRFEIIFDSEENKANLFDRVRDLHKKKILGEQGIVSLEAETLSLKFGKYGSEEAFYIISKRFTDINQVRDLVLYSVDREKFEVVIK
ncbi:MAG: hypothetical protein PHS09_06690 [Candidatus Omnitrophica bacterium]|nr:hypothetical protein [Candidatus Omnitrophota bacterium]MDD5512563.1 hypothetical protein [Candidatus Omnitrophota bacterium]